MIAEFGAMMREEPEATSRAATHQHRPPRASSIAVVTDSTADLDPRVADAAGIAVVPVAIRLDAEAFSESSRPLTPATVDSGSTAVAADAARERLTVEFIFTFSEVLRHHDAVVAILVSSRLSDAVTAAREARDRLPDATRVSIVDSRSVSAGLGLQVLGAAARIRDGVHLEAIVGEIEAARDRYHVVFSVESAEHLRRGGQIGRSAAIIAEMLQLKPLLRLDEGQIVPYERARTRLGAMAELAGFVREMPAVERVVVLYATEPEDAGRLAKTIATETDVPLSAIAIAQIGSAVAAHVGPGALGVVVVEGEE